MSSASASPKSLLVVCQRFYPPRRGGELAVFEQLSYLRSRGYRCGVLCFRDHRGRRFGRARSFWRRGIRIRQSPREDAAYLDALLRRDRPSVLLTYSFPAPRALDAAAALGIPGVLVTHSVHEISSAYTGRYVSYGERSAAGPLRSPRRVIRSARKVLVPSDFMKRKILAAAGRDKRMNGRIVVVRPLCPLRRVRAPGGSLRQFLTVLSADASKGAFLVVALAEAFPGYDFLVVGEPEPTVRRSRQALEWLRDLPNVRRLPFQPRMDRIYGKTKILLMPSLQEEAFGRAAWEAMTNGIPVIASPAGNLPELIGAGGLVRDPDDLPGWRAAVTRLMTDEREYRRLSRRARRQARRYDPARERRKLYELVESLR